ncbi:penicillin acylase family protein [Roseomonas populi]|uniref:Penicillin acylase family protein n=1 Tax=Roseomonas populi TaxID=3121582 RepID=A0ABT1XBW6_9PROT|nr:penicillin acylase family protein [Roseomonas pecuniae]MCR0985627.1 penicillin acylase family protein [Roseomonas pecuniae]
MMGRRLGTALLLTVMGLLPGCNALFPPEVTAERRLAALPREGLALERPVTIRWNAHLVPWIEAETDGDLAYSLGLVHGHLRGAQVQLLRLVARGRLSEAGGFLGLDVDHALRILDFGRAAPEIERNFPPETRLFAERFVAGLNQAILHGPRPPEAGLLNLPREPFTVADMLAVGRLAGTDVNWLGYFALLAERGRPGFAELYRRTLEAGQGTLPVEGGGTAAVLGRLFSGLSRNGSNAVAVAPERAVGGASMLASDPHLGLNLPNLWLIAGMRSPSYHVVGLMVPGLPFVGLGRNPDVAWGGTNLRAASSDLFDVSRLPPEAFREREVELRQRLWFTARRRARDTEYGPVLTDASIVPAGASGPLALRWAGHEPTDEITALLRGARARDGASFAASFRNFGVSAQNMIWADRGAVGRLTAAVLPDRAGFPRDDLVLPATPEAAAPWGRLRDAASLPRLERPAEGFVASANENPATWTRDPPAIGYAFSDVDRVARLRALLEANPRMTLDGLAAIQTDTLSPRAAEMARGLLARMDALPGGAPEPAFLAPLRGWDGDYREDGRAPVVFEFLLARLVRRTRDGRELEGRSPEGNWTTLTAHTLRDLDALPPARREAALRDAAREAAALVRDVRGWGEVHRLRAAHWLVNLPVVGDRFVYGDYPVGGSRETPMKTSHGLIEGRHNTSFGSMARFVTDMADPDSSRFVLFGGQDGWLGSAAFADQIPLWRERRHLRVPLRPATVAAEFPIVTVLKAGR